MKKIFTMLMVMCMIFMLTACGCDHDWADATCQAPKTCKLCGAVEDENTLGDHAWVNASCEAPKHCEICNLTEGEALSHTWIDADCNSPKTCLSCDAVEGEALGHDMAEANYQAPATCQRDGCGFTEGEALKAGFAGHGLNIIDAEMAVEYDYITSCWDKPELKTTGKLVLSDYQTFESDDSHEAVEGYVWHSVHVSILFNDENAWNYGMSIRGFSEDYYQPTPWGVTNTVNFNGVDYGEYEEIWSDWETDGWNKEDKTIVYTCNITWCMPVGYDGYMFGVYDAGIEPVDGQYIWEFMTPETLVFRFPAVTAE